LVRGVDGKCTKRLRHKVSAVVAVREKKSFGHHLHILGVPRKQPRRGVARTTKEHADALPRHYRERLNKAGAHWQKGQLEETAKDGPLMGGKKVMTQVRTETQLEPTIARNSSTPG